MLRLLLYRPPENHLGVIYRFDRLCQLVGPDEWVLVIPGVNEIKAPISLHLRRVEVALSDVLTQDHVPINCELITYYQLDLRHTKADLRSHALRISDEGWNSILRTVLREIANEVVGGINLQQLLSPAGCRHFKRALSALLAKRVQSLGVIVNPRTGVSVQRLRLAEAVWRAMMDELAAVALGKAAAARIRPILAELSQGHPEVAWEALLLEWAAAVVQQGYLPQVVIAPANGPGRGEHLRSTLPAALRSVLQETAAPTIEHGAEAGTIRRDQDGEQRAA